MVPPKGFFHLKRGKIFLFLIVFILITSFSIYSVDAFTWNRPTIIEATLNVNHSETSNSSDYWDDLDTPNDFLLSMFDGPSWIDEDMDFNGQDIVDVNAFTADTGYFTDIVMDGVGDIDMQGVDIEDIQKAYFGSTTYIQSDDNYHIDLHANWIDLHGNLSTIWTIKLNTDGDGFGGDSYGDLVFGSGDTYLFYNGSDFIIDPNAVGNGIVYIDSNISADYFIGDGSYLSNVNVSDAYAKYQFGSNNFNGSGNFTTTGNITTNYIIPNVISSNYNNDKIIMNSTGIFIGNSSRIIKLTSEGIIMKVT